MSCLHVQGHVLMHSSHAVETGVYLVPRLTVALVLRLCIVWLREWLLCPVQGSNSGSHGRHLCHVGGHSEGSCAR